MSSPQRQPHQQGVVAPLQLVKSEVPVERDRVRVVDGDVQVDARRAALSELVEQSFDQQAAVALAADTLQQVDVEVRREAGNDRIVDARAADGAAR